MTIDESTVASPRLTGHGSQWLSSPVSRRIAAALSVAVLAVLALLFVLWLAPDLVVDDDRFRPGVGEAAAALEEQRLRARHEVRLATAQAFAFLAILVGGLATWWTVRQTRENQITDRFTAAVEHLGSDRLSVRVAAIHALGRIARDSRRDHPAIMSVLGNHLRDKHPRPPPEAADDTLKTPHAEVRAVAFVLRLRKTEYDMPEFPIDLSGTDLRAAPLHAVQLAGAILTDANLRRADLQAADLTGARLVRARFTSAYLQEAVFDGADMTGVQLTAAHANRTSFRRADLTEAIYGNPAQPLTEAPTNVTSADFRSANAPTLEEARVFWEKGLPPFWPEDAEGPGGTTPRPDRPRDGAETEEPGP
jgi:uncharacterized membrane protein YqjE